MLIGAEAFDKLGHSVSGAFDVNGDGFADAAIGAPEGDVFPTTFPESGETYIISAVTACGNVKLETTSCGVGACIATGVELCLAGSFFDTCTPGAPSAEVCDNLDNNCDGSVDEGLGQTTCGVGACQVTVDNCIGGIPQNCTPGTPTTEICDGLDNDCDGILPVGELDVDGDGYIVCAGCDPLLFCADCDDADPATFPGASEVNDGQDNQCPGDPGFGIIDEVTQVLGFFNPADDTW